MKRYLTIIGISILVLGGSYFLLRSIKAPEPKTYVYIGPNTSGASKEDIAAIKQYSYTEVYAHPTYGFSFTHPANFTVTEVPAEGSDVIVVQDMSTNIGIQIMITPFENKDNILTKKMIKESIPDLTVKEEQELLIGDGGKGLAFISDNESFGGNSREAWFIYNNNLYQISTYVELDEFLKGLFATWNFQ